MREFNYNYWEPLSIDELNQLLNGLACNWYLAGGYAIEQFIGQSIRKHGDIDVLIERKDQHLIQDFMSAWQLFWATNPGLRLWEQDEFLGEDIQDIWCRRDAHSAWQLQLMLFDEKDGSWIFKRNPSIKLPLNQIYHTSESGMKYLKPEIQLLYKAKKDTLSKDQLDFDASLPLLVEDSKTWLLDQLKVQFPEGHPWISTLKAAQSRET